MKKHYLLPLHSVHLLPVKYRIAEYLKNKTMEEETKKDPGKPEKDGLLDKAKKFADKADDFIDENVEKVKQSKAFQSVANAMNKAGEYVEDKVEDIKSGKTEEELKAFAGRAEDKAEETISKAKEKGKKLAAKAADKLENLADKIRKRTGEDNRQENP